LLKVLTVVNHENKLSTQIQVDIVFSGGKFSKFCWYYWETSPLSAMWLLMKY